MDGNWQTWVVYAVVFCTAVIMLYFGFIRKKTGCGGSCANPSNSRWKRKKQ